MQILAIGEILWDVFDQAEILGGAPLNFSAAAVRLGYQVELITALGNDLRGDRATQAMTALGLSTVSLQIVPGRETGTAMVTTDKDGNANYFIKRPAAFDDVKLDASRMAAIQYSSPEWLYFGTLALAHHPTEEMVYRILRRIPGVKCFYDMNLREDHWNLPLVQRLSKLAAILKLNDAEAELLFGQTFPSEEFSVEGFCRRWSSTYDIETICITLGGEGCAIFNNDVFLCFDGFSIKVADTVGAGDAFAAAFLHGYRQQWPLEKIATFANALGAIVASRAGATPPWSVDECWRLIQEQRPPEAQMNVE